MRRRPAILLVLLLLVSSATALAAGAFRAASGQSASADARIDPSGSWNPNVTRWAVETATIGSIRAGDFTTGALTDSWPAGRTPGQPIPKEIPDSARLVQINNVVTSAIKQPFGSGIGDGDGVVNLRDPVTGQKIHSEISRMWGTIRMPDGSIRGPFLDPYPEQTVWPSAGTRIDVQGFVRRDDHNGWWELHPVSAWRIHTTATASIKPMTLRQSQIAAFQERRNENR